MSTLPIEALEIPPLPAVAVEVLRVARNPAADGRRIARVVERDPALAARVLRVARSPAYGSVPPRSLQQALARLGTSSLTEIVVAACLRPQRVRPEVAHQVQAVWSHAVATAAYARRISAVRRRHTEAAFLCGLLHSIGTLIVLQAGAEAAPAEVGVRAAALWGLPASVATAITHFDQPLMAPTHSEEVATTALAAVLAAEALEHDATMDDELLDWLDVYPDTLDALRSAADDVLAQVRELA